MSRHPFFNEYNKLTFIGMSGVGKTWLGLRLQKQNWFHYSVDYRIGTHYLEEEINDDLKRMVFYSGGPLAGLLRSDSVSICHKLTCRNLEPLSKFLGGFGGSIQAPTTDHHDNHQNYFKGIERSYEEFVRRQKLHLRAEIAATQDIVRFIRNAREIYAYPYFINDTSGSLCDIIHMAKDEHQNLTVDPSDETFKILHNNTFIIYIEADQKHVHSLIKRNLYEPKPIFYRLEILDRLIEEFLKTHNLNHADQIDPASFSRFAFPLLLEERVPRYRAIINASDGITLSSTQISHLINQDYSQESFLDQLANLIAQAISSQTRSQ